MADRIDKVLGVFGAAAATVIPATPVTGVAYRDETILPAVAEAAWPFNTIVDSKNFNQILYSYSKALRDLDKRGVLAYSPAVDYNDLPGIAWGSDGQLYVAVVANGPATTVVNPVGDLTGTWVTFMSATRGMFSATVSVAASGNLSATNVNKLHKFIAPAAAMGLPSLAGMTAGDTFTCVNHSAFDISFTRDGADTLAGVNGSSTVAILEPYSSITFTVSATAGVWDVAFFKGNRERRVLTAGNIAAAATLPFILSTLDPAQSPANRYVLTLINFQPAADDQELHMVMTQDGGATYENTTYYGAGLGAESDATPSNIANSNASHITVAGGTLAAGEGMSNVAGETGEIELRLISMNTGAAVMPRVRYQNSFINASGNEQSQYGSGTRKNAQDYDGFRLQWEGGGNFVATGQYVLYKLEGVF